MNRISTSRFDDDDLLFPQSPKNRSYNGHNKEIVNERLNAARILLKAARKRIHTRNVANNLSRASNDCSSYNHEIAPTLQDIDLGKTSILFDVSVPGTVNDGNVDEYIRTQMDRIVGLCDDPHESAQKMDKIRQNARKHKLEQLITRDRKKEIIKDELEHRKNEQKRSENFDIVDGIPVYSFARAINRARERVDNKYRKIGYTPETHMEEIHERRLQELYSMYDNDDEFIDDVRQLENW